MCSDDEDDDEDRGVGDMYADFFNDGRRADAEEDTEDEGRGSAPKAKRRKRARQRAATGAGADERDDDGVEEDGWDGEQLFDTGEGRDGKLSQHAALSAGFRPPEYPATPLCTSADAAVMLQTEGMPRKR